MLDIVKQINLHLKGNKVENIEETLCAAADEIERLRAALTQIDASIRFGLENYKGAVAIKIAREVQLIVKIAFTGEKTDG